MKYRYVLLGGVVCAVLVTGFLMQKYIRPQREGSPKSAASLEAAPAVVNLHDGEAYTLVAQKTSKKIGDTQIEAMTYNGISPGPVVRVTQDSTIHLTVKNMLNEETTLHPHGIRTENKFDGVGGVTQQPIKPGESFTYDLRFPDAGVFWYHPHMHEVEQQDLGMYGAFIVIPTSTAYWEPVNREEVLMVDDILMNKTGVVPYGRVSANYGLMGRYGNVVLVNGRTDYRLHAKLGEVIRLYVINAANARPFNLAFQGAKMKLVGGDNGVYEQERFIDHVILGPSERAIVDVLFDSPGVAKLVNDTPTTVSQLGVVEVSSEKTSISYAQSFAQLRTNTQVHADAERARSEVTRQPDKVISLNSNMMGQSMNGMMGGMNMGMNTASDDSIEWNDTMQAMNARMTAEDARWTITDEATGNTNNDIHWSFKRGQMVKVRIKNESSGMHPMQHPIHFHGQRFLVLSKNGTPIEDHVWKDTVLVPAGSTIDILVEMSNPGTWMVHCHVSEHLESGMMFQYEVR